MLSEREELLKTLRAGPLILRTLVLARLIPG